MAITKTTGLQIAIATGYGVSKNMTAVSNASEGVATLESSHGVAVNDIIELTSGWKYIDGRLVRAKAVATNDVTLEGIDTQSTTFFPATEGVGTVREVTGWQRITGIVAGSFQPSGGGFSDIPATESDDVREKVVPGLARAVSLDFKFHYPPAAAWRTYVEAAARTGAATAYRISIGAIRIYGNGYWAFNNEPADENGKMVGSIRIATVADSTYYAS